MNRVNKYIVETRMSLNKLFEKFKKVTKMLTVPSKPEKKLEIMLIAPEPSYFLKILLNILVETRVKVIFFSDKISVSA